MKLTEEMRERYSRMIRLRDFSEEDMERLTESVVAVVGAGGLGSVSLRLLTGIGFGTIHIIDFDKVELSNIQRQHVYLTEDIGKSKATAAAKNLRQINPNVSFKPIDQAITNENAVRLLKDVDIIVDGLDSFEARRIVNEASLELSIPYAFAGAVEYYANITTFVPNKTPCLTCVMGKAVDDPDRKAAAIGVEPTLLSIAASIQVREATLLATGKAPLLARKLLTIDTSTLCFEAFEIAKSSECPNCGSLGSEE